MGLKNLRTECSGLHWDDFNRLIENLIKDKEYKFLMLISIGCYCGLRVGDILKIRWRDLVNKNELKITEGKTGKFRKVTINSRLQEIIQICFENFKMQDCNDEVSNRFVLENRFGNPMSREYINRKLHLIFEYNKIEVQNGSSHTLRKTFGRRVYELSKKSEASLILLSEIFKHSSTAITKKYIGIVDEEIQSVYLSL